MSNWRPSASVAALRRRAQLLVRLRQYFAEQGVMEVETPLLASAPVTDPNIDAISTDHPAGGDHPMYLQTSPEFAMKRLLAAGSGSIFQICKAFRCGERGRRHNPEFSMLEWYRTDLDYTGLIDEVVAVIQLAVGARPVLQLTYAEAFQRYCQLDPFESGLDELRDYATEHMELSFDSEDRDLWLQLLMSTCVEAALPSDQIVVVRDFPASQAALAKLAATDGRAVARRFEVFYRGMELANGYDELRDASELLRRIRRDHEQRRNAGQPLPPIDRHLLKAMQVGLPECVGVAMGLDRLVMLAVGASQIDEVIAFPLERC